MNFRHFYPYLLLAGMLSGPGWAGDFSSPLDDPENPFDAPVPGFTGPHGDGKARLEDPFGTLHPENFVNPLFFAWASGHSDYFRSDGETSFADPALALGPVTGDTFDVVSLGDLDRTAIDAADPPGSLTLSFDSPIRNLSGADFVVFENGIVSAGGSGQAGDVFGELAFVEVSVDGSDFVRFPSRSQTSGPVASWATIDATEVTGVAGKHANGGGESWGTPFDLEDLGLAQISHVRLIDIPGSGDFQDSVGNAIHDPWLTFGSGGADIDAVGAIGVHTTFGDWPALEALPPLGRAETSDPDGDGVPNLLEYAFGLVPWVRDAGEAAHRPAVLEQDGQTYLEMHFRRDERAVDLTYEVQVSSCLSAWTTIAQSTGGATTTPAGGHLPEIVEGSALAIRSVGVVREVRVSAPVPSVGPPHHFIRLKVTRDLP